MSRDEAQRAFTFILTKLGRRDHSEQELRRSLALKGHPEDAVDAALDRARREGLVDDARFARSLARAGARSGKRGPLKIQAALRTKGIDVETAKAASREAFSDTGEREESLVKFAQRLLSRTKSRSPRDLRLKVMRSLVSRGFTLSQARRALDIAENDGMTENKGT